MRVVDFFPTKNISRNQLPKALSMEICWQIDGFGQNLPPPSWAKAWTISVCPCWQSRWTWSFGVLALDLRFRWCCDTFCIFCQGSNHQFGEYWVNGCFLDITIWRKSRFIDTPQQLNEETVQIHYEVEAFCFAKYLICVELPSHQNSCSCQLLGRESVGTMTKTSTTFECAFWIWFRKEGFNR